MNLHEYQARALLKAAGVPVPDGDVAQTPEEVEAIAERLGGAVVVKAQVHAGGRGKAGGVKLAKTAAEARGHAEKILGMTIKGLTVQKVLVAPAVDIATESYAGIILDRATQRPVFMVSPAGGVDIEEVAAKTPEKILKLGVDPRYGLLPHQAMQLAFFLYADLAQARAAAKILGQLYRAFLDAGGSLAEINPLVTTPDGSVIALDAKIVGGRQRVGATAGDRRPARPERGKPGGSEGAGSGPVVHSARRQRRVLCERGGARDGDDGLGQVLRRRAGELPRHRREQQSGEGGHGARDHHGRSRR